MSSRWRGPGNDLELAEGESLSERFDDWQAGGCLGCNRSGKARSMSVYFISAPSLRAVKIGSAMNPVERYRGIQTASAIDLHLVAVIDGGKSEEKALHRRFAEYRRRGEWFSCKGSLAEFIKSLPCFEMPRRKSRDDFIGALGGSAKVAEATGQNQSTVSMWRVRGVSWRFRPMIADMARKARVQLPDGFLDPIANTEQAA